MTSATALIAEDEPLLAAGLQMDLRRLWPDLTIAASVGNGAAALKEALRLQPDVVFLDIQMPGMTGLEAAQALAEDWPVDGKPYPLIVFVTAYDQYAVQAFDRAAFDYLLKPVQPARLEKCCLRLQETIASRATSANASDAGDVGVTALAAAVEQMRALLATHPGSSTPSDEAKTYLQVIQASAGNTITMVPIADVLYFEASDKYVRVVTAEREHLIRMSLRDLLQQIDLHVFWQIHRSVVVRYDAVSHARRDESGKLTLSLRGSSDQLAVSRLYVDRFKGM